MGNQLRGGPGAGGGQQAKCGKYFLHDYIFQIYRSTLIAQEIRETIERVNRFSGR
ncbi:hypothetical protein KAM622c_41490 [Klebsiella quasipneumoniae subsp. quasipneumoniae]|nr:hypothetical protein KAM622c_41490 [Klebsiella quasipneumoniae subsp. quasipneumoniae]